MISQADIRNMAKFTQSQDKRSRLNRQFNYAFVGNQSNNRNQSNSGLTDAYGIMSGGGASQSNMDEAWRVASSKLMYRTPVPPNELKLISQLKSNRQH